MKPEKPGKVGCAKALGPGGVASVLVSIIVGLGCAALSAYGGLNVQLAQSNCTKAHYAADDQNRNVRWRKWLYPPGKGYGTVRQCDDATHSSTDWTTLPAACPSSCPFGCGTNYSQRASRFNSCMEQVHRHLQCSTHMDCTGQMFPHHYKGESGAGDDFSHEFTADGTRCVFVDREAFLRDCEARTAYADQRSQSGWVIALTFAVPAVLLLATALQMTLCWRSRFAAERAKLRTGSGSEVYKRDGAAGQANAVQPVSQTDDGEVADKVQGALERMDTAANRIDGMGSAVSGDLASQANMALDAAEKAAEKLSGTKGGPGVLATLQSSGGLRIRSHR